MKTWHKVALTIGVIVGLLICIKSCMDRKQPDLTLAYIGHDFVNREIFEENMDDIAVLCTDITNDGEIHIDMMEITFNEELPQADQQNAWSKMTNAVGGGAARLYFIEEAYVRNNTDAGVFADISSLGDGVKSPDGKVVAISVEGNERVRLLGIEPKDGLYLAIRIVSEMDELTDKQIGAKNESAWNVARYIING